MTKREYIDGVLRVMNETDPYEGQENILAGADRVLTHRHIEESFVEAWKRCTKLVPKTWLANLSFKYATLVADLPDGTGYVLLPEDFFLLSHFKMVGWKTGVHQALLSENALSGMQFNSYARGSFVRPVCTIENRDFSDGARMVLNYYSLRKGLVKHEVESALYVPTHGGVRSLSDGDDIGVNDRMVEPLLYVAAGTALAIFEKTEAAKSLEQLAAQMVAGQ